MRKDQLGMENIAQIVSRRITVNTSTIYVIQ